MNDIFEEGWAAEALLMHNLTESRRNNFVVSRDSADDDDGSVASGEYEGVVKGKVRWSVVGRSCHQLLIHR